MRLSQTLADSQTISQFSIDTLKTSPSDVRFRAAHAILFFTLSACNSLCLINSPRTLQPRYGLNVRVTCSITPTTTMEKPEDDPGLNELDGEETESDDYGDVEVCLITSSSVAFCNHQNRTKTDKITVMNQARMKARARTMATNRYVDLLLYYYAFKHTLSVEWRWWSDGATAWGGTYPIVNNR
jgi:hypothetical protein